ncbi:hypothetical protein [Propionivibrio sp.]|jgi:hypothetical protein|uniref:hypothetical protein n=1 Tax=Propionivibrio sp. TaxID=2212460 RepID=UPI00272E16B5|nr:hypothetical protein [Propionivibrio sp.]
MQTKKYNLQESLEAFVSALEKCALATVRMKAAVARMQKSNALLKEAAQGIVRPLLLTREEV